jgi:cyanate permease
VLGATIITAGFGLRVVLTGSLLEVILGAFAVSAGVAISFAALPTLVVANVDSAETAAANGVNTLSRVVGCAIGSALFAAVTSALTSNVGGTRLPSTAAFITCFAIGGISALVAVCCATAIPRPRAEPKAATGARPPVAASIPGRRVA